MNGIPTDKPNSKTIDFAAWVRQAWGDEWHKKEVVYRFSERQFEDSGSRSGIYSGTS